MYPGVKEWMNNEILKSGKEVGIYKFSFLNRANHL
jgi:hypothetical protein